MAIFLTSMLRGRGGAKPWSGTTRGNRQAYRSPLSPSQASREGEGLAQRSTPQPAPCRQPMDRAKQATPPSGKTAVGGAGVSRPPPTAQHRPLRPPPAYGDGPTAPPLRGRAKKGHAHSSLTPPSSGPGTHLGLTLHPRAKSNLLGRESEGRQCECVNMTLITANLCLCDPV